MRLGLNEQFNKMIAEVKATRCQVCRARVKKQKDSPSGLRCPKCGRDYSPDTKPLKTDSDGKLIPWVEPQIDWAAEDAKVVSAKDEIEPKPESQNEPLEPSGESHD